MNGSLRTFIEKFFPAEYIGVDIDNGLGVDIICSAENLVKVFGLSSFDLVISTEMLEHVKDWQMVISNIKCVCKPGGIMLMTTKSYGFHYHAYPYDFWRYELDDMKNIFNDCEILVLENDDSSPGAFIKAKKSINFQEQDLSQYELYSIIAGKRINEIKDYHFNCIHYKRSILRYKFGKKGFEIMRWLGNLLSC